MSRATKKVVAGFWQFEHSVSLFRAAANNLFFAFAASATGMFIKWEPTDEYGNGLTVAVSGRDGIGVGTDVGFCGIAEGIAIVLSPFFAVSLDVFLKRPPNFFLVAFGLRFSVAILIMKG